MVGLVTLVEVPSDVRAGYNTTNVPDLQSLPTCTGSGADPHH